MSYIAIMMFSILSFVLAFAIFQFVKTKKEMPDDTSGINPARKLQQMDRDKNSVTAGDKKDGPLHGVSRSR